MNNIETITIPIKLSNEDGDNFRATLVMKRELFSNKPATTTVVWKDSSGEEVEHCYYENLSKEKQKFVDETINNYDASMVRKSL